MSDRPIDGAAKMRYISATTLAWHPEGGRAFITGPDGGEMMDLNSLIDCRPGLF